ncbi:MAG: hypothetical protein GY756_20735 [bacterium]|nr:hypothetical protein [bacterium]
MKNIISIIFLLFLQCYFLSAKEYTGVIVPLIKSTITSGSDADFNGEILHVARVGEIFKPEILDNKNKVIHKGTPLIIMDPVYWQGTSLEAKTKVTAATAALRTAKDDYYRYKKLVDIHSESMQLLEDKRAKYFSAITNLENRKIELMQSNSIVKACFTIAPFEGIVNKVFLVSGLAARQPQIIEISQLNPIGININMPREEADKLTIMTPVTIYSNRTGKAYGIYNKNTILTDDGVTLIAENRQVFLEKEHITKGVKTRYHSDVHNVFPFPYSNGKMLSVQLSSIKKIIKGILFGLQKVQKRTRLAYL